MHRVKVGGWSQARYQRRVENAHLEHVKEVLKQLEQIIQQDQIAKVVLAGDSAIVALLEQEMPKELAAKVETMKLDVHSSAQEVFQATLEKLREQESTSGLANRATCFCTLQSLAV